MQLTMKFLFEIGSRICTQTQKCVENKDMQEEED